jgi:hypothetical protein
MSAGPQDGGPCEAGPYDGDATDAAECVPPSAAGHLEPYGARVRLRPEQDPLAATPFLRDLLTGIAAGCMVAGATVIGHLKCVLRTEAGVVPCSLTSLRSGAVCRGGPEAAGIVVTIGEEAELDLAVLVYGVPAKAVDEIVLVALERLLGPAHVHWAKETPTHPPHC